MYNYIEYKPIDNPYNNRYYASFYFHKMQYYSGMFQYFLHYFYIPI